MKLPSRSAVFASIASAMLALLASHAAGQPAAPDAKPRVVRTFTHHQVTNVPQGTTFRPALSDSGNRILFGLNPAAEGKSPALAVADFDGSHLTVLDDSPGIALADLTADGSRVVYSLGSEIRSVAADGTDRRTLFKLREGDVSALRVSGDGQLIVVLISRDWNAVEGDKVVQHTRGVYGLAPQGGELRLIAGPEQVAALRGIKPEEAGNPNFTLEYRPGSINVSSDGRRVIFGCWVKDAHALFGCETDGSKLRTIAERPYLPGDYHTQFVSIALSGDGTAVAYRTAWPNEVGVADFGGKWARPLLQEGKEGGRFNWGFSDPIYITADGSRTLFQGRHFNSAGSGWFQLMATHQDGVLRYHEYEMPAMDAVGRRFAYWPNIQPLQVATIELNVPWDQLRGAPKISEVAIDPPAIPRLKPGVAGAKVAARALGDPTPAALSGTGFRGGLYDDTLAQGGGNGTNLNDDGKPDASGDAKAGDGVFTGRWLGPCPMRRRTLRGPSASRRKSPAPTSCSTPTSSRSDPCRWSTNPPRAAR